MMVQPKDPPLSFRPGKERLARIEAFAAERKLSRHLAILVLLDEGYRSLTKPTKPAAAKPAKTKAEPAAPKVSVSVPFAGDIKKRPMQKGAKK